MTLFLISDSGGRCLSSAIRPRGASPAARTITGLAPIRGPVPFLDNLPVSDTPVPPESTVMTTPTTEWDNIPSSVQSNPSPGPPTPVEDERLLVA